MEHNGEPLPDDLIAEILSVTGGEQRLSGGLVPRWRGRRSSPTKVDEVRPSAACDVSFPLRVGFDEHPLYRDVGEAIPVPSLRHQGIQRLTL
jgi:hypothetical protein